MTALVGIVFFVWVSAFIVGICGLVASYILWRAGFFD
jgi:hypothetical protein